jgi:hypothetical protein
VKTRWFVSLFFLISTTIPIDSALLPNRGNQLFVLIQGGIVQGGGIGVTVVAMTPREREVLQEWDRYSPRYDFISAIVKPVVNGSKVKFTRCVMKKDYMPRVETIELFFPHAKQAHYAFFDIGTVTGFYRESAHDFDPHELWPQIPHLTMRWSQPLPGEKFIFDDQNIHFAVAARCR